MCSIITIHYIFFPVVISDNKYIKPLIKLNHTRITQNSSNTLKCHSLLPSTFLIYPKEADLCAVFFMRLKSHVICSKWCVLGLFYPACALK